MRSGHEAAEVIGGVLAERPVIAVSVGTKVQSKDWGRENWRALLARLAETVSGAWAGACGCGGGERGE